MSDEVPFSRIPKRVTDEIWKERFEYYERWIKRYRRFLAGDATVKRVKVSAAKQYVVKGRRAHVRYILVSTNKKR